LKKSSIRDSTRNAHNFVSLIPFAIKQNTKDISWKNEIKLESLIVGILEMIKENEILF